MRVLNRCSALFLLTLVLSLPSNAANHLNEQKPGFALGEVILNIGRYNNPTDVKKAIDQSRGHASTPNELSLTDLAGDFLPCVANDQQLSQCYVSNITKYGSHYDTLMSHLNETLQLAKPYEKIGMLFRCALDELQGTKTNREYRTCLDAVP